jgi:L-amino acid N-acyltransferase YncA
MCALHNEGKLIVERTRTIVSTMLSKLVEQAWQDGYQTALAQCETAVYSGEDALHQLLKRREEGT